MDTAEYRLAIAHACKLQKYPGNDLALVFDDNGFRAVAAAPIVDPQGTSTNTPIVNLLRSKGERLTGTYNIYTTAPPTPMCRGMARMCGITAIYYLEGGTIKKFNSHRYNCGYVTVTPGSGGDIPNVTELAPVTVTPPRTSTGKKGSTVSVAPQPRVVAWYQNVSGNAEALKKWFDDRKGDYTSAEKLAAATPIVKAAKFAKFPPSIGLEWLNLAALVQNQTVRDNVFMMWAMEIVGVAHGNYKTNPNRSDTYRGQNIGSLLVDASGNVVGWGVNTNLSDTTLHGEVNIILNYQKEYPGESLPDGSTLYTTLEPCEMCSGMIVRAIARDKRLRVIYGLRDYTLGPTSLRQPPGSNVTMAASEAIMAPSKDLRQKGTLQGAQTTASLPDRLTHLWSEFSKEELELKFAPDPKKESSRWAPGTRFLEQGSTKTNVFNVARPLWFIYLWDYLTSEAKKIPLQQNQTLNLAHPEVQRLSTELDNIYLAYTSFLSDVRGVIGS